MHTMAHHCPLNGSEFFKVYVFHVKDILLIEGFCFFSQNFYTYNSVTT